jgi:hypothetical protein
MSSLKTATFKNHVTGTEYTIAVYDGGQWLTAHQLRRLKTRVATETVPLLAVINHLNRDIPTGWQVIMYANGTVWIGPTDDERS